MPILNTVALRSIYEGSDELRAILDVLPVCHFFAKDYRGVKIEGAGHFLIANRQFLEDKGLDTVEDIRIRTDFEFYPDRTPMTTSFYKPRGRSLGP